MIPPSPSRKRGAETRSIPPITGKSSNPASWSILSSCPPSPSPIAESTICRSEEHTSELQSLMRISYAVFYLNQNKQIILQLHHIYKLHKNKSLHPPRTYIFNTTIQDT